MAETLPSRASQAPSFGATLEMSPNNDMARHLFGKGFQTSQKAQESMYWRDKDAVTLLYSTQATLVSYAAPLLLFTEKLFREQQLSEIGTHPCTAVIPSSSQVAHLTLDQSIPSLQPKLGLKRDIRPIRLRVVGSREGVFNGCRSAVQHDPMILNWYSPQIEARPGSISI